MQEIIKPAIVVVAYNRPDSLSRILKSIENAIYDFNDIELVISIDKNKTEKDVLNNQRVKEIAENFEWKHGNKRVIAQGINLGLRKHILKCGDLTEEYGSIIMLEDDLIVSNQYYQYSYKALDFYKNDNQIAGISLYNHKTNFNKRLPFEPIQGRSDIYFLQICSSWGQAWTLKQWKNFKEWYAKNIEQENNQFSELEISKNITSWPESSWLKYFIKYMILENKFFIYPVKSFTTNFTDAGTHNNYKTTLYQVSLYNDIKFDMKFQNLSESFAVYDSFFENLKLKEFIENKFNLNRDLTIDFYSDKNRFKRYLLTTEILNYEILKGYSLELRPYELNVLKDIEGQELFIYDTDKKVKNKIKNIDKTKYLIPYVYFGLQIDLFDKLKLKIKKIIKR